MINLANKWDEVGRSSRASVSIRVAADHKLNLYVGYSDDAKRQLKLRSDIAVFHEAELPEFENIGIKLEEVAGKSELCITLGDNSLKDLFSAISSDLVMASSKADTEAGAAQVFANRLARWAELLKERKRHGLTLSQQLGLLGELYFLDWVLARRIVSAQTAIKGWRGPDGDARDINLGTASVEMKATLGTTKNVLKISSLDQLDTEDRRLVVAYCRFSPSDDGFSMAELIERIEAELTTFSAEWNDFRRKVYLVGYDAEADYTDDEYELIKHKFYEVRKEFPRLTPGNVPTEIRNAQYEIDCTLLTSFEIDENGLEAMIDGRN